MEPMAQPIRYHHFSDSRTLFSILNFWNVVSSLLFLVVGLIGLYQLLLSRSLNILREIKVSYTLLFLGVTLVAFGSSYYHLWPSNQTLVWDRLCMVIAFMALFSIVISEFISIRVGKALLLPLIFVGVSSVIYWHLSETWGKGDLRFYALVQFLPMIIIPVILVCFCSYCSRANAYWMLLLAYVVSKFFEQFDAEVYSSLGFISGHTIKHIVAAFGIYLLLVSYQRRNCKKPPHLKSLLCQGSQVI
ncbi:ceramidase domain-containing protein [Beggiatoa alba]|nr:ceramidase domain-containing protein [Beggiatoa alba]